MGHAILYGLGRRIVLWLKLVGEMDMWGKFFSVLLCLLLFGSAIGPVFQVSDWYKPDTKEEFAVKALTPPDAITRADAYGQLMQKEDLNGLRQESDPSILNSSFYNAVPIIAKYGTLDVPKAERVLGYHFNKVIANGSSWTDSNIVIAHYFSDKVIIETTSFREQNGVKKIIGFDLRRLTNKDIASLKFNLIGKTPTHYVIISIAIFILIFSLVTLYVAMTRPELAGRWWWFVFVLFGIARFSFNWGDESFSFNLTEIHAPQAAYGQNLMQFATISFWLPVGAVLFWLLARRKKA